MSWSKRPGPNWIMCIRGIVKRMGKLRTAQNNITLWVFTALLGAAVGIIVWCFVQVVRSYTSLLWEFLPDVTGLKFLPVIICTVGGFCMGLLRRKYGDYPEELPVVLGKIKRQKHYDYHPMLVMIVCAMIPLVFGASVGPEAGLTAIIAGLCYWIGDNVKYAKEHTAEYSEVGAAVTLGSLFHMPLFGIFAMEEEPAAGPEPKKSAPVLSKTTKLLLYGLSVASAFLVMKGLGVLIRPASEGFPSFEEAGISGADYALMLLYIPIGLIVYLLYAGTIKGAGMTAKHIPVVVKETICGLCVGLVALAAPMVLFSGEEELGRLPDTFTTYAPMVLVGVGLLKVIMTAFCIEFGLKGGHFFPLIFACSCVGFGISMLFFPTSFDHAVFAAAIVTAATLGAQMQKPFAVSMLLLLCFPFRVVLWIFLAAVVGGKVGSRLHI